MNVIKSVGCKLYTSITLLTGNTQFTLQFIILMEELSIIITNKVI